VTRAPSGAAAETHPEESRSAHRTAQLSLCLAVGAATVAVVSAWTSLGPDSLLLRPFNSDGAVPVLMANQTHWDFLSAFYWGEDRYGAWPFFVAHGLSLLFRVPVTPEFLHGFSTLFLFSGALAAALLFRPYAGLGLLAFTASVLLPESRGSLFDANPYAWQLPLLLWAWWCVRESLKARRALPLVVWLGLAALASFFATWTSALSGPLLLGVSLLEGWRAQRVLPRLPRGRLAVCLVPSLLGMAGEAVVRWAFHRFARASYGRGFHTELRVDWGHLLENTRQVGRGLEHPVVLGALAVLVGYTVLLLWPWPTAPERAGRWSPRARTVWGAFLLGLLPLPVLALVRHVRMNGFEPRYFTPSYVFLVFGALLALTSVLPERRAGRTGRLSLVLGTLLLCAAVLGLLPRAGKNLDYARLQQTARALGERAPGATLLDGYWGTYLFAALAPPGALLPLPNSGDYNRMPAYEAALSTAPLVVVGHRKVLSGPPGSEPVWLFQYGTLLESRQPRFLSDGVDSFSLYRPRAVEDIPFQAQPPLENLSLEAGAEVTVRAQAAENATVLAVELSCLSLSQPPSGSFEDSEGRTPLRVEQVPGAVFFFSDGDDGPVTLHLVFGRAPCQIRRARWFWDPERAY
jgi:hypothetical protein